jgi:ribosomal protein S27AE
MSILYDTILGCDDSIIMRSGGTSQQIYDIFAQKARAGIRWASRGCAKVWDQRLVEGDIDVDICKKQSFNWYSVAVKQGDVESLGFLAAAYLEGSGCTQSPEKAFELYIRAANQGRKNTQCFLGACYHRGRYVQKSVKTALYWYMKCLKEEPKSAFPLKLHPPGLQEAVQMLVTRWTTCGNCGDTHGEKYICGQCEFVSYCDEKCQVIHWDAAHRVECSEAKKLSHFRPGTEPLAT